MGAFAGLPLPVANDLPLNAEPLARITPQADGLDVLNDKRPPSAERNNMINAHAKVGLLAHWTDIAGRIDLHAPFPVREHKPWIQSSVLALPDNFLVRRIALYAHTAAHHVASAVLAALPTLLVVVLHVPWKPAAVAGVQRPTIHLHGSRESGKRVIGAMATGQERINRIHFAATSLFLGVLFALSHRITVHLVIPRRSAKASWLRPFLSRISLRFMPEAIRFLVCEK